jgi:Uma2 family endonuclease
MNATAFSKIDKAEFYRLTEGREGRYELDRGYIVQQMTGGTLRHGRVADRIKRLVDQQLDLGKWLALPDRGVETAQSVRYPDVVVEPVGGNAESLATLEPVLVVEVLSPSTTSTDLNIKPGEYLSSASLQAYIVASQSEPACLVWVRGPNRTFPSEPVELDATGVIEIGLLGLRIAVADIYRGIIELPSGSSS